jgi:peptidoglycan/LPS O-acetylase OafA/YrhL
MKYLKKEDTVMSKTNNKQHRYMPGLDGLRALAVLSVIAYHLNFPWATGGFLGVTVFFVLSGYLITDLLVAEWSVNKKIDLKNFWIRRAKRLLPGMFTLLLVVFAFVSLFQTSLLADLKQDTISALFYYSNWWYIFHDLSYFESFGPPPLLNHFWSLAVEEQFYIIWPILILLVLRFLKHKSLLFLLTIIGAAISIILMAYLFHPGLDPSRVYYGTDTRAFSLLIGAALAMVWPSRKLTNKIKTPDRIFLDSIGLTGLTIFLIMIWKTNQYESFLYEGGMFLISISTAMLIAAIAHPASLIGRFLSMRPLKWIGLRSYGIYLWHFPVIVLLSPKINTGDLSFVRTVLQLLIIFMFAALSYRFIEDPIRKGKLQLIWKQLRSGQFNLKNVCFRHIVIISTFILLFAISGFGLVELPKANGAKANANLSSTQTISKQSSQIVEKENTKTPSTPDVDRNEQTSKSNDNKSSNNNGKPVTTNDNKNHQTSNSNGKPTATNDNKNNQTPNKNENEKPIVNPTSPPSKKNITVIGDSVVINAIPYLQQSYPTIKVDAKIGRQFSEASKIIDQNKKSNQLGEIVIIELGTNGAFTKKQMTSLINSIGNNKKIIFVNTRVPKPWESVVNKTLREGTNKIPNTKVVDWYKASANQNSYFLSDGVHLKPAGAKAFASLLKSAIESW